MFTNTRRLLQERAIRPLSFRSSLDQIWPANNKTSPRRIGLAISGGVDSMALAWLCSAMKKRGTHDYDFTAFVVDHKLRQGSTEEAAQVSKALAGLGLRSRILTLDWQKGRPIDDMESAARRMRYRALGQACYKARITSLWLAHHSDDQAETVLMRIANGYLGTGLAGMRAVSQIPECEGMYGVHESGYPRRLSSGQDLAPRMLTEAGGVSTVRPLLPYSKTELIATCEEAGVRWFEDETNKDPSVTLRNSVRLVHGMNVLPKALQRPRLRAVAGRVRQRIDMHEHQAKRIFRSLEPVLDTRIGRVQCHFPLDAFHDLPGHIDEAYVQANVLRRLVQLVSPHATILLSDMAKVARNLLAEHPPTHASLKVPIAGVLIVRKACHTGGVVLTLERTPPRSTQVRNSTPVEVPATRKQSHEIAVWSGWHLWDNRFWIRLGRGSETGSSPQICFRFLTVEDIASVRKTLDDKGRKEFNNRLDCAKGHARLTLPAIFRAGKADDGLSFSDETAYDRMVALPSLGWSRDGWRRFKPGIEGAEWLYEIRYKHVDDSLTWPTGKARARPVR